MIKKLMRRLSPVKRLKNIFVKPEGSEDFVSFIKKMDELNKIAEASLKSDDPMSTLVKLYNIMHDWRKKGITKPIIQTLSRLNYGQYTVLIHALAALEDLFEHYEASSENDIMLGNIYGLFTHPISFWRGYKDEPKGGWGFPGMDHLNAYDVVKMQARSMVEVNVKAIVCAVDGLRTVCAAA